uniref:Domain of unknown function DB domain-containing protein n=1 Tax=Setaria digitata TaxID=48799 RepID=A0A915Q2X0_9BILA
MERFFEILVLSSFAALIQGDETGYSRQLMLGKTLMGGSSPTLMQHSPADEIFRACCSAERISGYCTDELCSISKIALMTADKFVSTGMQCGKELRKIFGCAVEGKDQTGCCAAKQVPADCYDYCSGEAKLDLRNPKFTCLVYSAPILECLKANLSPE